MEADDYWLHAALQVLDDSTDKGTRDLVDDKVLEWKERGVEIEVRRRTNRAGYKAGALHEVNLLWASHAIRPVSAASGAPDVSWRDGGNGRGIAASVASAASHAMGVVLFNIFQLWQGVEGAGGDAVGAGRQVSERLRIHRHF